MTECDFTEPHRYQKGTKGPQIEVHTRPQGQPQMPPTHPEPPVDLSKIDFKGEAVADRDDVMTGAILEAVRSLNALVRDSGLIVTYDTLSHTQIDRPTPQDYLTVAIAKPMGRSG